MADPIPEGEKPPLTKRWGLARWRWVRSVLAGVCLAFGMLWLFLILKGPLGPLTNDTVAQALVVFVTVWVVADLVVGRMTKRARLANRG